MSGTRFCIKRKKERCSILDVSSTRTYLTFFFPTKQVETSVIDLEPIVHTLLISTILENTRFSENVSTVETSCRNVKIVR